MEAQTRLPTPVARRSRLRSDTRLAGSMESTAMTESRLSMLPTRANITMYFMETALVIMEKSGKATASSRLPGSFTRYWGPSWKLWPARS